MTRFRARGRYDIVCVFESGSYLRITSRKDRSLSPREIAAALREWADRIEHAIESKRDVVLEPK
jgi:hypothetical protein